MTDATVQERCARAPIAEAVEREWLVADGRGGYGGSTVPLCPTRRYHGLLVTPPPGGHRRFVFLSRFEESLHGPGIEVPLSVARYPGAWHPLGYEALAEFQPLPWPTWRYASGGIEVRREILVVRGSPTVLCRWSCAGAPAPLELRLRPLLPFREAEALTRENLDLDPRVRRDGRVLACRPYGSLPEIRFTADPASVRFEADPVWYRRIEYPRDLERGYDGHEDQFSPGTFVAPLEPGGEVVVASSLSDPVEDPAGTWRRTSDRLRGRGRACDLPPRARLESLAEDFLFEAGDGRPGIVAGYPWFGEWGRDTFISLPGLTIARGRTEEAGGVLESAVAFVRDRRLPNVWGRDRTDSAYGSLDTALWFTWAARAYERAGGNRDRVLEVLLPVMETLALGLAEGAEPGVAVDDTGLLRSSEDCQALTWMDARVGGVPVTPRRGCPVEVNALWCSALRTLGRLRKARGDERQARDWFSRARRAGAGFLERLWLQDAGVLADTWDARGPDASVRPNMLVAAALEESPLDAAQRASVVARAEELRTPYGLRTLSPKSPGYVGLYRGDVETRDRAYHQGAAWPWLTGFHVEAALRAQGRRGNAVKELKADLDGTAERILAAGNGLVPELFDGDPPHRPGGAVHQAWSVGGLLWAYHLLEPRTR